MRDVTHSLATKLPKPLKLPQSPEADTVGILVLSKAKLRKMLQRFESCSKPQNIETRKSLNPDTLKLRILSHQAPKSVYRTLMHA